MSALQSSLTKRKDRAIATLLGFKERELDKHLSAEASSKFRKILLDQMNEYHEVAIDMIRSLEGGDVMNELYLQKLDEILSEVKKNA